VTTIVPPVLPPSEWQKPEEVQTQLLREINAKLGAIRGWITFFGILAVVGIAVGVPLTLQALFG
jgi:hypothetical protein